MHLMCACQCQTTKVLGKEIEVAGSQKRNAEKCTRLRWLSKNWQINLYATTQTQANSSGAEHRYTDTRIHGHRDTLTPTSVNPHKALWEQSGLHLTIYLQLSKLKPHTAPQLGELQSHNHGDGRGGWARGFGKGGFQGMNVGAANHDESIPVAIRGQHSSWTISTLENF